MFEFIMLVVMWSFIVIMLFIGLNAVYTDGYFVCSIGNVSKEQLQKYIENQG